LPPGERLRFGPSIDAVALVGLCDAVGAADRGMGHVMATLEAVRPASVSEDKPH
jgi:hypothetical protein